MLTENTISKLREIRLGTMAEAFREQLTNPEISSLSFEDRFDFSRCRVDYPKKQYAGKNDQEGTVRRPIGVH